MYMPGLFRTGSSPCRTWIWDESYVDESSATADAWTLRDANDRVGGDVLGPTAVWYRWTSPRELKRTW